MTPRPNDARAFRDLHHSGLLVLPNAWDAGSARLMQLLGAKAIATTSAGVAWAHGYADGNFLPVPLLLESVRDIARVVSLPLSVDIEGGYAADPAAAAKAVASVVEAGAVGINLEDGSDSSDLLCAKIEAVKKAASHLGVDLFVNARTDVYLRTLVPAEKAVAECVSRAAKYQAAGADGIFVPGVVVADEIRALAAGTALPLNVLARPGLPPASELARLGARRLSAGSGITQAIYGRARSLATEFLKTGASEPLSAGAMPYAEINKLLG